MSFWGKSDWSEKPEKSLTVNMIDVVPVAAELRLLTAELSRTNFLLEQICRANGVPTSDRVVAEKDLRDTATDYGVDPEFEFFINKMEVEAGRKLTEAEAMKVYETWKHLDTDS